MPRRYGKLAIDWDIRQGETSNKRPIKNKRPDPVPSDELTLIPSPIPERSAWQGGHASAGQPQPVEAGHPSDVIIAADEFNHQQDRAKRVSRFLEVLQLPYPPETKGQQLADLIVAMGEEDGRIWLAWHAFVEMTFDVVPYSPCQESMLQCVILTLRRDNDSSSSGLSAFWIRLTEKTHSFLLDDYTIQQARNFTNFDVRLSHEYLKLRLETDPNAGNASGLLPMTMLEYHKWEGDHRHAQWEHLVWSACTNLIVSAEAVYAALATIKVDPAEFDRRGHWPELHDLALEALGPDHGPYFTLARWRFWKMRLAGIVDDGVVTEPDLVQMIRQAIQRMEEVEGKDEESQ